MEDRESSGAVVVGKQYESDQGEDRESSDAVVFGKQYESDQSEDQESSGAVVDGKQYKSDQSDDVPPSKKLKIQLDPLRNSLVLSDTRVNLEVSRSKFIRLIANETKNLIQSTIKVPSIPNNEVHQENRVPSFAAEEIALPALSNTAKLPCLPSRASLTTSESNVDVKQYESGQSEDRELSGVVVVGMQYESDQSKDRELSGSVVDGKQYKSGQSENRESSGAVVVGKQYESDQSDDVPPSKKLKIQLEPLRNSLVLSDTRVNLEVPVPNNTAKLPCLARRASLTTSELNETSSRQTNNHVAQQMSSTLQGQSRRGSKLEALPQASSTRDSRMRGSAHAFSSDASAVRPEQQSRNSVD